MSKFHSIVSTLAGLASIAVTTVGVYKAIENNKQHTVEQQKQIERLKTELAKKTEPTVLSLSQTPAPITLPAPQLTPSVSDSVEIPPAPELPVRR